MSAIHTALELVKIQQKATASGQPLAAKRALRQVSLVTPEMVTLSTITAGDVREAASAIDPDPTEAQQEAGNHAMGHIHWNGLEITLEVNKGGYRRGIDKAGIAWKQKIPHYYGYIKRINLSEDKG